MSALGALALGACGDDEPELVTGLPNHSYAGRVDGSDAYIGIFVDPAFDETPIGAFVFVTDGVEVAEWFTDSIEPGTTVLTSHDGDAELELEGDPERFSGRFEPAEGDATDFEAPRVEFPAGLYDGYGELGGDEVQAGAVLLDDGSSRAALLVAGEILPATVSPRGTDEGGTSLGEHQLDLAYGDGDSTWRVRFRG